jgi:ubiquitin carboxyl-terminal hydrolase 25/28
LVKEVMNLFSFLARSEKKYADPTNVLKSIIDDYGHTIEIGNQEDIPEFNLKFLERIQEGLNAVNPIILE